MGRFVRRLQNLPRNGSSALFLGAQILGSPISSSPWFLALLQELAVLLIGVDDKGKVIVYSGVPEAVQQQGLVSLDWLRAVLQPVGGKGGGKGALVTGQVRLMLDNRKQESNTC